jgi:hypothetical protein
MKIGGSLARNARFEAPTCLVSIIIWFSSAVAVSTGEAAMLQDLSFSKVSKQVVMSFCVAGVALGILTKAVLCDRRNTFARFSEEDLHFSWQAQHFGCVHRHFA